MALRFTLSKWISILVLCSSVLVCRVSLAADLQWSGTYRFEGVSVINPDLTSQNREKNYLLHHLVLRPKIVASDGIIIHSRFDIFNNANSFHSNSQLGQFLGNGPASPDPSEPLGSNSASSSQNSNVLSQVGQSEIIEVNHLYLTWLHEHGALIVGRAPMQFGLGITHNAGEGLFDHWLDTRDLVGYKIVAGNFYFFPMYAKVNEGELDKNDDIKDWMIHVQYENPETDISMGVFFYQRDGNRTSNDAPRGEDGIGGAGSEVRRKWSTQHLNIFAGRESENLKLKVEGAFQNGKTGIEDANGSQVSLSGFGLAGELEWIPRDSAWAFGLNAGLATGDDPTTTDKYEGFVFDRNYDFTLLLFQQPLGQADVLGTTTSGRGGVGTADTEAISNALYFSPYTKYKWSEKWIFDTRLTYAQVNETRTRDGDNMGDSLGYEWDLGVTYTPHSRFMWKNQVGLLFPGEAWQYASRNFENDFAYGFFTRAAVTF